MNVRVMSEMLCRCGLLVCTVRARDSPGELKRQHNEQKDRAKSFHRIAIIATSRQLLYARARGNDKSATRSEVNTAHSHDRQADTGDIPTIRANAVNEPQPDQRSRDTDAATRGIKPVQQRDRAA